MYLFFFKWDLQIVTDWVSEIQVSGTYIKVIFKMLTYISGFMRRVLITSTHHFMSTNTTVSKFNYIYYYYTFMHFQKYCQYILYQYLLWFILSKRKLTTYSRIDIGMFHRTFEYSSYYKYYKIFLKPPPKHVL